MGQSFDIYNFFFWVSGSMWSNLIFAMKDFLRHCHVRNCSCLWKVRGHDCALILPFNFDYYKP